MTRPLLPGDWVEVRSAPEIAGTLDAAATVDGLPFMPEMLPFAGRRFRVAQRASRTCVHPPQVPFPRLSDSVVLDGLRCDGSLHGGCGLGCMFFWKEAWLQPVDGPAANPQSPTASSLDLPVTRPDAPDRLVCQATELPRATTPGPPLWEPAQYVRFVRDRTYTVPQLARLLGRMGSRRLRSIVQSRRSVGSAPSVDVATLDLRTGEWVEVKSREEIERTLDTQRMHKGLAFSGNMVEECGRRRRVAKRVETIVEERTGRLRSVSGTVTLEGSICDRYLGCSRGMPFLWRELWLRRVESPADPGPGLR